MRFVAVLGFEASPASAQVLVTPGCSHFSWRCQKFSLSQRERAGVRENGSAFR